MFFDCFSCRKVVPLINEFRDKKECPSCGSLNDQVISKDRFEKGFEVGVYFNIDPNTGKRSKKKKR